MAALIQTGHQGSQHDMSYLGLETKSKLVVQQAGTCIMAAWFKLGTLRLRRPHLCNAHIRATHTFARWRDGKLLKVMEKDKKEMEQERRGITSFMQLSYSQIFAMDGKK